MRKTIEEIKCDVCKQPMNGKNTELTVVFTTEQDEGRSCTPYLTNEKVDLCDDCKKKILYDGKQLFGAGAMGYNKYYFKEV